jgi:hypothetical protein
VSAEVEDQVQLRETLIVQDAMKMQTPSSSRVKRINTGAGS